MVEFVYNVIQGVFYSCLVYFTIGFGYDASEYPPCTLSDGSQFRSRMAAA